LEKFSKFQKIWLIDYELGFQNGKECKNNMLQIGAKMGYMTRQFQIQWNIKTECNGVEKRIRRKIASPKVLIM
jgi:hypothetical protein